MLTMHINNSRFTDEIKDEFNRTFPFLKLEFFKTSHGISEPSSYKEMIKGNHHLKTIRKTEKEGYLDILPDTKVSNLETAFRDDFGLNVQVFRKSGTLWLETSLTDHLTLNEQNEMGKEMSMPIENTDSSEIDYD